MNDSQILTIIDIGSHKLEEMSVLVAPSPRTAAVYAWWALKRFVKAVLKGDFGVFGASARQLKVVGYYFLSRRKYALQIVSVEPNWRVVHKPVARMSRKYSVHSLPLAVLGHDASRDAELKTLHFYGQTISSSIYRKSRLAEEQKADICAGVKFDVIWDGLLKEGVVKPGAPFLLRMNCEGAELGVIEACASRGLKPLCIIGSLADVDKIHGRELGDKMRNTIQAMGTSYFYFVGDNPSTWHDMIPAWEKVTASFRR